MRIDRVKLVSELTRQDMTQKELSQRAKVSRATINYIKCGKSCREDIGLKIAKVLNVKIEDLLED